ncbi:COG4223 family protein [Candidatus Liberibacter brunswickensis]|uniref:COG4223 family protein n=1 Tax=Candidatus Liberibacter brunswickensis TaxID=1968796 RepID=UPI002FE2C33B
MTPVSDYSTKEPIRKSEEMPEKEKANQPHSCGKKLNWRQRILIKIRKNRLLSKLLTTLVCILFLAIFIMFISFLTKKNFYNNDFVNHFPKIDNEKSSYYTEGTQAEQDSTVKDLNLVGIKSSPKLDDIKKSDIKSLLEEISSLKKLISDINENYQNIVTRLEKTESLISNPLRNPDTQRMISLLILKNSMDKGEYFLMNDKMKNEFSILKPCTAVLMKFANTKIPTTVEILTQFPKVSEEMIFASESLEHDAGFTDYLLLQLNRLIKIRPVGENIGGSSITAIIARIENNIKAGDLVKAASEWDNIPEKAKKPGVYLRNAIEAHICSDAILKEEMAKIEKGNLQ